MKLLRFASLLKSCLHWFNRFSFTCFASNIGLDVVVVVVVVVVEE